MNTEQVRCDLCDNPTTPQFILTTPRLDGPLVRCETCGLYFVVKSAVTQDGILCPPPTVVVVAGTDSRHEPNVAAEVAQATALRHELNVTTEAAPDTSLSDEPDATSLSHEPSVTTEDVTTEMDRLAVRAMELSLVEPHVEQSETPWRIVTAQERLRDLQRFISSGRLLEIGCSTGEFLTEAQQQSFTVTGIEADAHTSAATRARGLNCLTGSLFDAQLPASSQEAIALYHVIEHLPSPSAVVHECERLLAPGGWLVIEAPNIQTIWYRLLGARWRQFIPDHLYFFTPATLRHLCEQHGLRVVQCRTVGKAMSLRLFISRVSRYSPTLARLLSAFSRRLKLDEFTVRLNLGDVMRLYAQKR